VAAAPRATVQRTAQPGIRAMIRHGSPSPLRPVIVLPATPPLALPSPTADQMDGPSNDPANHLRRKRLPGATIQCLRGNFGCSSRHKGISRKPKNT
jgi:hypothetical protein